MDTLTIIILILATARLTRLVTTDDIFQRPRLWLIDTAGGHSMARAEWWESLLGCPWCIGWWLSVVTTALTIVAPGVMTVLLAPWALSYAVGTIEQWNDPA